MVLDSFLFSVNAIFPVFVLMGLGYLLRIIKICDIPFFTKANNLSFRVFLPVMLFYNIYDMRDSDTPPDFFYMGLALAGILVLTSVLLLIVPRLVRDKKKIGVMIQGIFRSNFLLLGIPMVSNMFGESELWSTSLLIPVSIPVFNILAVVVLSCYIKQENCEHRVRETIFDILKNPLIIGAVLGFLFLLLRIPIPDMAYTSIKQIGGVATPLALISLGGKLEFGSVKGNLRYIIAACVGKLVLFPLVMIPITVAFGYRASALGAILAMFGAPTAVSSYVMAEQTGNDGNLAGQIVAFTTVASALTFFFWIFILREMGYL